MAALFRMPEPKVCRILADEDQPVARNYRYFREFLEHNRGCLQLIAALESLYYRGEGFASAEVRRLLARLRDETAALLDAHGRLSGVGADELRGLWAATFPALDALFAPPAEPPPFPPVVPFEGGFAQDPAAVGSKASNLAVIRSALGLPVPDGFVATTAAEAAFLDASGLRAVIRDTLDRVDPADPGAAETLCAELRARITGAEVPPEVERALLAACDALAARCGGGVRLAVRSSAVGEDTAASFAGQYRTVLDVAREGLLSAYKEVVASRFDLRAVLYRRRHGFAAHDTPMGVACLCMVAALVSGVVYTRDPLHPDADVMSVAAVAGAGERLVGGEASPVVFAVDRTGGRVLETQAGGASEEDRRVREAVEGPVLERLWRMARELEDHFGGPQDVEWALDGEGGLFVLQSRPLGLQRGAVEAAVEPAGLAAMPVLLEGGVTAAPGIASGIVCRLPIEAGAPPEDAILVAPSASIDCVKFLRRARGIVTDFGSAASHLATVARELGVPALFDTREATRLLSEGESVTLAAESRRVYRGRLDEAEAPVRRAPAAVFESPMFLRLREVLDHVAALNLGDPGDASFTAAGCRTVHDVVRFCHEHCLRAMFGLSGAAGESVVSRTLDFNIPVRLSFIDLGGGLEEGLTTCDGITPESMRSVPLRAFWRGLSHPGINWTSAVGLDLRNLAALMTSGTGEGGLPGGASYALVSRDYLNISVKFGYHYCNVDSLCGEDPQQNHVSLQFAGGVGPYHGKVLRVAFLSRVLARLGFSVSETGDTLSAVLKGLGQGALETALDQLGRLLASSRLLDLGIRSQADIERMEAAFFRGEYDYLNPGRAYGLPGFYVPEGDWSRVDGPDGAHLVQDGSAWAGRISRAVARGLNRLFGTRTQLALDNVRAYFYFPLAIAKDGFLGEGEVEAAVMPVDGVIDRAGGVAFGIRNIGNYFVFRLNGLEGNLILFEYVNNRRIERAAAAAALETGRWHRLRVRARDRCVTAYLDGEEVLSYVADRSLEGHVGLWTKADSVTRFEGFRLRRAGAEEDVDLFAALKDGIS